MARLGIAATLDLSGKDFAKLTGSPVQSYLVWRNVRERDEDGQVRQIWRSNTSIATAAAKFLATKATEAGATPADVTLTVLGTNAHPKARLAFGWDKSGIRVIYGDAPVAAQGAATPPDSEDPNILELNPAFAG